MHSAGLRLRDFDADELLSYGYYRMVRDLDADARERVDRALQPDETAIVDDPMLPESMRGIRPPTWWKGSGYDGTFRVDE